MAERKTRIYVDSTEATSHRNCSPYEYTVQLDEPIPDAVAVQLMTYNMPYTPVFEVIRVSRYLVSASVADRDAVHRQAVTFAAAQPVDAAKADRPGTIYTADGTVALQVIDCYTAARVRGSDGAVRTYDAFICVGSLSTVNRDGWNFHDVNADVALPLTGPASETGTAASTPGTTSLMVRRINEPIYMSLDVGNGLGWLRGLNSRSPEWASFRGYYPGDIVTYAGQTYAATTKHLGIVFAEDSEMWREVPAEVRRPAPANHAFHVFETAAPNETRIALPCGSHRILAEMGPTFVREIKVGFHYRNMRPYVFPLKLVTDYLDDDSVATVYKEYEPHSFTLEFTWVDQKKGGPTQPCYRKGTFRGGTGLLRAQP